jgi:hypothetical protein
VRYGDFKEFVREAYGIDPLPKQGAALNIALECSIGLINNDTKQNIALKLSDANIFKTITPIKKGSKFKIEIKNNSECYIYIFTPDVNNKSLVLFPYKPIHSSYCGITGYRLFPRKESIQADEIGNKEVMGIVVSKQELDYKSINESINKSSKTAYGDRLNEALSTSSDKNVHYSAGANGSIYFKASGSGNSLVSSVVEIEKQ